MVNLCVPTFLILMGDCRIKLQILIMIEYLGDQEASDLVPGARIGDAVVLRHNYA